MMINTKDLQSDPSNILSISSLQPPKEEYTVPAGKQFSGVQVSRGTLATFGDDTAKQFALHVDKLLREKAAATGQSSNPNAVTGLLVRGGDISAKAAFLKNNAVKTFESNMSVLLNSSLRQREIRQRENDAPTKIDDKKNNDDEVTDSAGTSGGDSDAESD